MDDRKKKPMKLRALGAAAAVAGAVVLGGFALTAPASAAPAPEHAAGVTPMNLGPAAWFGPWSDITSCVTGEDHFDGVIYTHCIWDYNAYYFYGAEYIN
jgi:hypothetical protein